MDTYLHLLFNGNPCSIILLILILTLCGQRMVEKSPSVRLWGWRLAALTFVVFGLYAVSQTSLAGINAEHLLWITFRSLLVSGLSLGLSWITLSMLKFCFHFCVAGPWKRIAKWVKKAREKAAERKAMKAAEVQKLKEMQLQALTDPEREREAKKRAEHQHRREIAGLRPN